MILIGICGGIGSGKSVVSRILRLMGFSVFDCDMEAKRLMADNAEIKRRICNEISSEVTDGDRVPDRRLLASIVFSDSKARLKLNSIVHSAVGKELDGYLNSCQKGWALFVEAAILAESGLAERCDHIWRVEAPLERRIARIIGRDAMTREEAEARIRAQEYEEKMIEKYNSKIMIIHNDEEYSLLQQIQKLLKKFPIN